MEKDCFTLTLLIRKAITRAAVLHKDQKRKVNGAPFIIHPFAAAFILARYTYNENIIAAALLHDTLEDVPGYTFEDLKEEFGEKIAKIVKEVSEEKDAGEDLSSKQRTWKKRKDGYLNNLENASYDALMVSCADKIHNLLSLLDDYEREGKSILKKFNAAPDEELWFYQSVFNILSMRLDNDIVDELEKVLLEITKKNIFNC